MKKTIVAATFIGLLLSFFSFFIFRYIFFAVPEQAVLITLCLLAFGILILKKGLAFKNHFAALGQAERRQSLPFYLLTFIALFAIGFVCFSVLTLGYSVLWQDDWRMFQDYLFRKDLWHSIFDRQNEHLSILQNILYLFIYHLLDAKGIWFVFFNLAIFSVNAYIFTTIFYRTFNIQCSSVIKIAATSTLALCYCWLAGDLLLFWGIGSSNNLSILGMLLAVYALSRQLTLGWLKSLGLFAVGATISSISFGTGAAVWTLGFLAVLLVRRDIKTILSFFIIGVIGGLLIVGTHTNNASLNIDFSLFLFLKAIPTFLGTPIVILLKSFVSAEHLPYWSLAIGLTPFLLWIFYLVQFWLESAKEIPEAEVKKREGMLFFMLIASFIICCAVLIVLGRSRGDFTYLLAERYMSWTVLFLASLLALILLSLSYYKNKGLRQKGFLAILSIAVFALTAYNLLRISVKANFINALDAYQLDLVVHPDKKGGERQLWQGVLEGDHFRATVLKVATKLKEDTKNIYTEKWTTWLGKDFQQTFTEKLNLTFEYKLAAKEKTEHQDLILQGWVNPKSRFQLAPSNLVFVAKNKIIGMGIPSTSATFSNPNNTANLSNLFNLVPRPFSKFPGISNFYNAQLNLNLINETETQAIQIMGIFSDGTYVEMGEVEL